MSGTTGENRAGQPRGELTALQSCEVGCRESSGRCTLPRWPSAAVRGLQRDVSRHPALLIGNPGASANSRHLARLQSWVPRQSALPDAAGAPEPFRHSRKRLLSMECGRPTRQDKPCRNLAFLQHPATASCDVHRTDAERHDIAVWRAGFEAGRTQGRAEEKSAAEQWARAEARAEARRRSTVIKLRDTDGAQLVTVDNGFAYRWRGGADLNVGDKTLRPPAFFEGDSMIVCEVVSLGSSYDGEHRTLSTRRLT